MAASAYGVINWRVPRQAASTSCNQGDERNWEYFTRDVLRELHEGIEAFEALTKLIDYQAFLMRLSQGPVDRRFDIRWWRTVKSRDPVLVRWKRVGNRNQSSRVERINVGAERQVAVEEMRESLRELLAMWWEIEADWVQMRDALRAVSYTHLTLPTNREV